MINGTNGTTPCRLCQGSAHQVFEQLVLNKYRTPYFECASCGSLQTTPPDWLAEAYAIPGVHIDVGQAARVIQTWLRLCLLLRAIEFDSTARCIDYGGSTGLLTRLMRDSGYDYFAYDLYDNSKYANYFKVESLNGCKPALISAFEVIEHLPEPKTTLTELLSTTPELLIFSTQFYERQGPDWPYLVPICGQHVFFYSQQALQDFADSLGYELRNVLDFWAFVRRRGRYLEPIDRVAGMRLDTSFIGEHVLKVGWGTDSTVRDSVYAFERFGRELLR